MDANYIAYETLIASRSAAFWTMISSFSAVFTSLFTFFTVLFALKQLKQWREQEKILELKNFRLAVFKLQSTINLGPEIVKGNVLVGEQFEALMRVFNAGDKVYETTLVIHDVKTKSQASEIYSQLADIIEEYSAGQLSRKAAIAEVLKLRTENHLLNPPK
ncbi:hypothetical protein [Kosakonia cowanii]|uniref:hypothetical protein n=1 Tax=Kosakonia cowanii TaxID=208223 RepID=UPI00289E0533|nr:hypothetical protein [Kosakonia cowanii]